MPALDGAVDLVDEPDLPLRPVVPVPGELGRLLVGEEAPELLLVHAGLAIGAARRRSQSGTERVPLCDHGFGVARPGGAARPAWLDVQEILSNKLKISPRTLDQMSCE